MTGEWDLALLRCEEVLETVSPDIAGETFLELFRLCTSMYSEGT